MDILITAGFDTLHAIQLLCKQDIVISQLATLGQSRLLAEGVAEIKKNGTIRHPLILESGVANLASLLASCDIEDSGADSQSKRNQNSFQPDQDLRLYLRSNLKVRRMTA